MKNAMFDPLADLYERYRSGYSAELFGALEAYGLAVGTRVLDVGCGTALVGAELVKRGCELVGVDVSAAMLEYARKRVPSAQFLVAAAEQLPFADASFDVAIVSQAFHWFDRAPALAEMTRIVRPGGFIAVCWKQIMRGDPLRGMRDEVAQELGFDGFDELVNSEVLGFLEQSSLCEHKLCIIPWIVKMTGQDCVGYERSRARARAKFGDVLERYIERLALRLAPLDEKIAVAYVQYLFLGTVPVIAQNC
ncbi:MAG TPA: class I SAM-dependent methyltransferase [Candidatus Baltobacteraceae bacterium]